jgi:ferric-dicitrate binding protein FerR (iron transport regulator)
VRLNIFRLTPAEPTPAERLQSEARDWLILLTSGRATVADARALRQWCAVRYKRWEKLSCRLSIGRLSISLEL